MKNKILYLIIIVLLVIIGIISYKAYNSYKVPELKELYVLGKKIDVVKGKRIYRIYYEDEIEYLNEDGTCKSIFSYSFENDETPKGGIVFNGFYAEDNANKAYYFLTFSDDETSNSDNFDYYFEVTFKNPINVNVEDCNSFVNEI